MEILVNESKVVKFLRKKVEPQQLRQIIMHFRNQTKDANKWETTLRQLINVLKTATKSGVIQEVNTFYFANTHVEDVQKIMMAEDDWFIPSDTSLGSTGVYRHGSH
ncbi:uncharacterized protein LOC124460470 [Drosophila willistoni]|uniref:uncharacterized protein LOC124460470 n=1 Tax=Drosophila willistoni TaxID=7260 RepID=UPI001F081D09|nr:uncharacterized protein LOC124460470 [Drosophila willistoni]